MKKLLLVLFVIFYQLSISLAQGTGLVGYLEVDRFNGSEIIPFTMEVNSDGTLNFSGWQIDHFPRDEVTGNIITGPVDALEQVVDPLSIQQSLRDFGFRVQNFTLGANNEFRPTEGALEQLRQTFGPNSLNFTVNFLELESGATNAVRQTFNSLIQPGGPILTVGPGGHLGANLAAWGFTQSGVSVFSPQFFPAGSIYTIVNGANELASDFRTLNYNLEQASLGIGLYSPSAMSALFGNEFGNTRRGASPFKKVSYIGPLNPLVAFGMFGWQIPDGWDIFPHYAILVQQHLSGGGQEPNFLKIISGTGKAGEPVKIGFDGELPTIREVLDAYEVDLKGVDGTTTHMSFSSTPITLVPNQDLASIDLLGGFADFEFSESFDFSNSNFGDLAGIDFTAMDVSGIRLDEQTATLNFIYELSQGGAEGSINLDEEEALLRKVFLQALAVPNDQQYISLDVLSNPRRGYARADGLFKQTDIVRYFFEADVEMKKDVLFGVMSSDGNGNSILQRWVELVQSDANYWQQLNALNFNAHPYITLRGTILPDVISSANETQGQLFFDQTQVGFQLDQQIINLGIDLSAYPLSESLENYIQSKLSAFRIFLQERFREEAERGVARMNAGEGDYKNLRRVLSAIATAHWYKSLNLPNDPYAELIDSGDLTGIASEIPFDQAFWDSQADALIGMTQLRDFQGNQVSLSLKGGVTMRQVIDPEREQEISAREDSILETLKTESFTVSNGQYFVDGGQGAVELPEVSIVGIEIPFAEPLPSFDGEFVYAGSTVNTSLAVINSGNRVAQNVLVELFARGNESVVPLSSATIPALGVGETQLVQLPFMVNSGMNGEISLLARVTLDPSANVELEPSNNFAQMRVLILDPKPIIAGMFPRTGSAIPSQNAEFIAYGFDMKGEALTYAWSSDIDGLLSQAAIFTADSLTPGYHTISLTVTNVSGLSSAIQLTTFVYEGSQDEPVLNVNYPIANEVVRTGEAISAIAIASDFLDGNLCERSTNIIWSSSLDGELGGGCSPTIQFASPGLHTITITATNSTQKSVSQSIAIQVMDGAPNIALTGWNPTDNLLESTAITFTAEANDGEDGDLSQQIIWSSSLQGYLGSGGSVTRTLSPGMHVIQAIVSNSLGLSDTAYSSPLTINGLTGNNQVFQYAAPDTYLTSIRVRNHAPIKSATLDIQGIGVDVSVPDGNPFTFPLNRVSTAIDPVSIPAFPLSNSFYGIAGNNTGGIALICSNFNVPESPELNLLESVWLPGQAGLAEFIQLYVESGARIGFILPYEVNIYIKKGGNITYLHPGSTGTVYYEDGAFLNEHDDFPAGVNLVRVANLTFQYPNGVPICTAPSVSCPPSIGTSLSGSYSSAFELGESRVVEVDYHPNAARYHWTLPVGWTAVPLNGNGNKVQITAPNVPSSGFLRVNNSNDCASSGTISLSISSGLNSTRPLNPRLDVGADGTLEWAPAGTLTDSVTTGDFSAALNAYISSQIGTEEVIDIPMRIFYQGGGQIIGTNLSIEYAGSDVAIKHINAGPQPIQYQSRFSRTTVYATLQNEGDIDLVEVDAALWVKGAEVARSDQYVSLPAGESDTVSFQLALDQLGEQIITVVVDPDSLIAEIDEQNNRDSVFINVVDVTPPSVKILSLSNVLPSNSMGELEAIVADNDTLASVELMVNDIPVVIGNPAGDSLYLATFPLVEVGSYTLSLTATDVSGRKTTVTRIVEVVDNRADLSLLAQNIHVDVNDQNRATFTYRIENIGGTEIGTANILVFDADSVQIHQTSFPLAAGADTSISFGYDFPLGEEGIYSLAFIASADVEERSLANNTTLRNVNVYDRFPPTTPVLSANTEWTNQGSEMVSWEPSADASGIQRYEYRINGGAWSSLGLGREVEVIYTETGIYTIEVRALDSKGNKSSVSGISVAHDQTPPSAPLLSDPFPMREWVNTDSVSLSWSTSIDEGSGIAFYQLTINGEGISLPSSVTTYKSALQNGANTISVVAIDSVGLMSEGAELIIQVDRESPVLSDVSSPTHPFEGQWYASNEPVFQWNIPDDASGIDRFYYEWSSEENLTLNSSNPELPGDQDSIKLQSIATGLTGDIPIHDGMWYFHLTAVDSAGNEGVSSTKVIKIDMSPPQLILSHNGVQMVDSQVISPSQIDIVEAFATDPLSGVSNIFFQIEGEEEQIVLDQQIDLSGLSDQSLAIYAKDNAGNISDTIMLFILPNLAPDCVASDTAYVSSLAEDIAFELMDSGSLKGLTFLLDDLRKQTIPASTAIDSFRMGIRFEEVRIDPGATVNCARLVFHFEVGTSVASYNDPVRVFAEATPFSLPWEKSVAPSLLPREGISSRNLTNASHIDHFQFTGLSVVSLNISSLVQEVIDAPGWVKGNSLSLVLDSLVLSRFSPSIADSIWDRLAGVSLLIDSENITDPSSPLTFNSCPGEVAVGDSIPLSVTLFDPEDQYGEAEILLESSADSIASVDPQTGILVGNSTGIAIISASIANSSVITRCTMYVTPALGPIDSSQTTYHTIPGRIEAEEYSTKAGGILAPIEGEDNGIKLAELIPGNGAIYLLQVNQAGRYQVDFRIASEYTGGMIRMIFFDPPSGTFIGESRTVDTVIQVISTGGWNMWDTISIELDLPAGEKNLSLGFLGEQNQFVADLDWVEFRLANPSFQDVIDQQVQNSAEVKAYPNPFSESLIIDMSSLEERASVSLFNLQGQEVWSQILDPEIHEIDGEVISELSTGLYILEARTSNGEQYVVKIQKK